MARKWSCWALYSVIWSFLLAARAAAGDQMLYAGPENTSVVNRAVDLYSEASDAVQVGDLRMAIQLYRESIEVFPNFAGAYNNLAMLVFQHDHDEAQAMELLHQGFDVATAVNDSTNIASIHLNIGYLLREIGGRFSTMHALEAIHHFDAALAINPNMIEALSNKGLALVSLHEMDEAEQILHRALTVNPSDSSTLLDLAFIYFERGDLERSIHHLDQIIAQPDSPNHMSAISNKAVFLREAGYFLEALETQALALKIDPDNPRALSNIMTMQRMICDWNGLESLEEHLVEVVKSRELSVGSKSSGISLLPYDSTLIKLSDAFRRQLAVKYAATFEQPATVKLLPSRWSIQTNLPSRLRVGYLSFDFREHPMGHLTLALIDSHDRERIEVYCFSYGPDDRSEWRQRIEQRCDVFRDIRQMADLEAADQIARDQPDVLVDLMAHTKGARQGITALSPSPIVVNYLGFPGTTGATSTQFAFVDKLVVPPEVGGKTMTESIVYLPTTYQANQFEFDTDVCGICSPTLHEDSDTGFRSFARCVQQCQRKARQNHGLPKEALVFCNFNVNNKMDAASFGLWMSILRQVPGSVLWLLSPRTRQEKRSGANSSDDSHQGEIDKEKEQIEDSLRSQAASMGIAPSRIIFAPRVLKREHLSRIALADLFLDSLVYNAHSTASDALWAHVPIVTLWGDTFPSRVAASLIENAVPGHPEVIPFNLKEYETSAVELARDASKRLRLRATIASQSLKCPLFDTARTTKNVESALESMHDVVKLSANSYRRLPQIVVTPNRGRGGLASEYIQERFNRTQEIFDKLVRNGDTETASKVMARLALSGLDVPNTEPLRKMLLYPIPTSSVSINIISTAEPSSPGSIYTKASNELIELLNFAKKLLAEDRVSDLVRTFEDVQDRLLRLATIPATSDSNLERLFLMFTFVLDKVGRTVDAIAIADHIVQLQPSFFRLRFNLGAMYSNVGDYVSADAELASAAAAESDVRFKDWRKITGNDLKLQSKLSLRPIGKPVIAIYCNEYGQGWWGDWGPSSIGNGLGGSEEAVVFLSRELVRLGYYVEVYAVPPPQDETSLSDATKPTHVHEASWYPLALYDPNDRAIDVFIAWRYATSLVVGKHARRAIYWAHDIPTPESAQSTLLSTLAHRIVCVSSFHASYFPPSIQFKIVVLRNAVDPSFFTDGPNTNNLFVYGSAPNRGLEPLLLAWPTIRARIPEATLQVFYGFTPAFERWARELRWPMLSLSVAANETTGYEEWRARMNELLRETPGVEFVGLGNHEHLARAYANAGFWVYPTRFSETSCISAMKAMANGAIPITSRFASSALSETIGAYDQGPIALNTPEQLVNVTWWAELWAERIDELTSIGKRKSLEKIRADMKGFARRAYHWERVAIEWSEMLRSILVKE